MKKIKDEIYAKMRNPDWTELNKMDMNDLISVHNKLEDLKKSGLNHEIDELYFDNEGSLNFSASHRVSMIRK